MQTAITARHFALTGQMKDYVTKRLTKLERYSHHIVNAEIILSKDAGMDLVEGKVHLKHDMLTAKGKNSDLYLAVTKVVDRLETQLKRHDERMKDRKKTAPRRGLDR